MDIKEAIENGKYFALYTGHGVAEISEYREQLKDRKYAILERGVLVDNLKKDEMISVVDLDETIVDKVFDAVKDIIMKVFGLRIR